MLNGLGFASVVICFYCFYCFCIVYFYIVRRHSQHFVEGAVQTLPIDWLSGVAFWPSESTFASSTLSTRAVVRTFSIVSRRMNGRRRKQRSRESSSIASDRWRSRFCPGGPIKSKSDQILTILLCPQKLTRELAGQLCLPHIGITKTEKLILYAGCLQLWKTWKSLGIYDFQKTRGIWNGYSGNLLY